VGSRKVRHKINDMKIKSLKLSSYKRFVEERTFDFTDENTGLPKNLIALVGQNGCGKSSVLQAIASVIGTAVGKLKKPSDLDWAGFNYNLINSNPNHIAEIDLGVYFADNEINATIAYAKQLSRNNIGNANEVNLYLNFLDKKVYSQTISYYNQFKGREFAIKLRKINPDSWNLFQKVGGILWYTEHRNSTSATLSAELAEGKTIINEQALRRRLNDFFNFHFRLAKDKKFILKEGQRDVFDVLNQSYSRIFQGRKLIGTNPSRTVDFNSDAFFYLSDGKKEYEISEMSGAERAIFPILLDFAWWQVNNSIILIDELELHLHPPLQQAFLRALPYLGENNQFIITTHSDYVASLISEDAIYRLD
jgi:predicted ATP-dependent endonuclease of OLD family